MKEFGKLSAQEIQESLLFQPDFSRAHQSLQALKACEGSAWNITEADEGSEESLDSEQWHSILLMSGQTFNYDMWRIEVRKQYFPNGLELSEKGRQQYIADCKDQGRDWNFVGVSADRYTVVFARPWFKEFALSFSSPNSIQFEVLADDDGMHNVLKVNNLNIILDSLPLDQYEVSAVMGDRVQCKTDEAIKITIERDRSTVDAGDEKPVGNRFTERNPDLARLSLRGEMREAISILRKLGYKKIVAYPSDARRHNVYMRAGMKEFPNSPVGKNGQRYLIMDIAE